MKNKKTDLPVIVDSTPKRLSRRSFLNHTFAGILGLGLGSLTSSAVFNPVLSSSSEGPGSFASKAIEARIIVNADSNLGPVRHAWAFFGHDEANYAFAPNGKKLLKDLNRLSPVPVHLRAHHLFTSGDPHSTSLKWSPTNVYTEDDAGNSVYNWTRVDKIFDAYMEHQIKPLVEIGFMPKALSVHPDPYKLHFGKNHPKQLGWTYPPKDYHKWAALVKRFVEHLAKRYGKEEAASWYWEVWNEPDIFFWQGTTEEYLKLYDHTVDAVKRVLPSTNIGGPSSTAPKAKKSAIFLRRFLEHCSKEKNYATGETGAPIDFISFHTKGTPKMVDGHIQMGMKYQLDRAEWAFSIIADFPELSKLPIIIGESDPDHTAAFAVKNHPELAYRQGAIYPTYYASVYKKLKEAADRKGLQLEANLSWAFEFEDKPWFSGYRELATHGVNKAILNGFRMLGLLNGHELKVESSDSVKLQQALQSGISERPDINALAATDDQSLSVLIWNYHDDDVEVPPANIEVALEQLPVVSGRLLMTHFRIDKTHSNAYTVWRQMGKPQNPTLRQVEQLKEASELKQFESPRWVEISEAKLNVDIRLPRYGVSLLKIDWSNSI